MGLFAGKQQFKASHHVHTSNSDGGNTLSSMIEEHYQRGYDILIIADHNVMTRDWVMMPNGLSQQRFDEIAAGVGRSDRPLLMVPNTNEQTWGNTWPHDHVNTLLADYENITDVELLLAGIESRNGLSHLNHIGRTLETYLGSGVDNSTHIHRYVNYFMSYANCVGLEIINSPNQYGEKQDRVMWDNINLLTIPQGRYVWGFANDDSHSTSHVGYAFNMMVMPANTLAEFTKAMLSGSFYAVARVALSNVGAILNTLGRDTVTPVIHDINVSASSVAISAENHSRIDWISSNSRTVPISQGDMISVSGASGNFIRANVIGPGGVAFTRPFRIEHGAIVDIPPEPPPPIEMPQNFPYRLVWFHPPGSTAWRCKVIPL